MSVVIVGILLLVFLVIFPYVAVVVKKTNSAWSTAAKVLGLTEYRGTFMNPRELVGFLDDFPVHVDVYKIRESRNRITLYTRFQLTFPALGLGLKMTPESRTPTHNLQATFGPPEFTGQFEIESDNPDGTQVFFTDERKTRILEFFEVFPQACIEDGTISINEKKMIRKPEPLIRTLRGFAWMAKRLTGEPSMTPSITEAIHLEPQNALEN